MDALAAAGYDVWLENWRASIEFPPREWTLDQAALYDHPQAVRKIVAESGYDKIKAIIHCQGSTSFSMSALAGLVPEVTTIVSTGRVRLGSYQARLCGAGGECPDHLISTPIGASRPRPWWPRGSPPWSSCSTTNAATRSARW